MAKLGGVLTVFVIIQIQVLLSLIDDESFSNSLPEHSETIEAGFCDQERENSVANSQHLIKCNHRKIRSTSNDSYYGLQYEQICRAPGNQPCTCYYPDHPDVVQFQLGVDEITTNATKVNGTGPSSCEDLKKLGHFLNGFYMIHFNTKRVKATYCVFNQTSSETFFKIPTYDSFNPITANKSSSKVIRFCGGVKGKPCRFYYSDNPDSPQHGYELSNNKYTKKELTLNATRKPSSCKDLQLIGHVLSGFYMLHFNTVKVRIVYCNFKSLETDSSEHNFKNEIEISSNSSKSCNSIGSQPCSCYMSNHPNLLQFELSNDEITRAATNEKNTGPENCQDLKDVGYTINGFYMVRENSKIIKIVFCEFNQKDVATMDKTTSKSNLSIQSLTKKAVKIDYLTSTKAPQDAHQLGTSLLLINKHMKCLAVNTNGDVNPAKNGDIIIQSDCNPSEKGQLWKQNRDRICNDWNKCISTPLQKRPGSETSIIIHWELNHEDQRQQFRITNENHLTNLGKCLGIKKDANYPGVEAKTSICNENEYGQIWHFVNTDEYKENSNKNYRVQTSYQKSELVENHSNSVIFQTTSHRINQQKNQIKVTQPNYFAETTEVTYIKPTTLKPTNLVSGAINPTTKDYFSSAKRFPLSENFKSLLLMNNHGKCLAVNTKGQIAPSENGARIIQSECNGAEKGQLWQLKEDRLCNDWNKCICTPLEQEYRSRTYVIQWDPIPEKQRQIWEATNNNRLCNGGYSLGISDDSNKVGAEAKTVYYNEKENGQVWHFVDIKLGINSIEVVNNTNHETQQLTTYQNTNRQNEMIKIKSTTTKSHNIEKVTKLGNMQYTELKDEGFRLLKNDHGKCLAVNTEGSIHPSEKGAMIIQSYCNSTEKGQRWNHTKQFGMPWHLCNDWNKCLSIPLHSTPGDITSSLIQDDNKFSTHQRWGFLNGIQLYNNGRCLASKRNSGNDRTPLITDSCNSLHEGQKWFFCDNCL